MLLLACSAVRSTSMCTAWVVRSGLTSSMHIARRRIDEVLAGRAQVLLLWFVDRAMAHVVGVVSAEDADESVLPMPPQAVHAREDGDEEAPLFAPARFVDVEYDVAANEVIYPMPNLMHVQLRAQVLVPRRAEHLPTVLAYRRPLQLAQHHDGNGHEGGDSDGDDDDDGGGCDDDNDGSDDDEQPLIWELCDIVEDADDEANMAMQVVPCRDEEEQLNGAQVQPHISQRHVAPRPSSTISGRAMPCARRRRRGSSAHGRS